LQLTISDAIIKILHDMKNHFKTLLLCLTGALLFVGQSLYAQQPLLRALGQTSVGKSSREEVQNQTVLQNVRKKAKGGRAEVYGFNKAALMQDRLLFQTPAGEIVEAVLDERDLRNANDFSWHGHLKDRPGSVVIIFLDDQISGNVLVGNKNYNLSPLGKDQCILYEIESATYPDDHPPSYREDVIINVPQSNSDPGTTGDHCGVIRLLVAFTPAAESGALALGYSNMKLFVQAAISETNQSFINSSVFHRVSLAVAIRVNYTESSTFDTDLDRFEGTSDSYMDEVHTYRNLYTADVGVLLINNSSSCGLATNIGSNANTAFCVAHYGCALGNYTFGHEIAHLHGCRHNLEVDNTLTPYAYGHGFCYAPGDWRTIMSYSSCATTRIQYWSNPNVTFGGVAMGTTDRQNNARVLNETSGTLSNYRLSPAVLVLNSSANLINNEVGFATATAEIILTSGFVVASNSELRVAVMTPSCDAPLISARTGTPPHEDEKAEGIFASSVLKVTPVPTTGILNIEVNLPQEELADIGIYNLVGKRIQNVYQGQLASRHFTVDLSNFSNSLYILKLQAANGSVHKKVILSK
jgi:hypothetical protein